MLFLNLTKLEVYMYILCVYNILIYEYMLGVFVIVLYQCVFEIQNLENSNLSFTSTKIFYDDLGISNFSNSMSVCFNHFLGKI